MSSIVNIKIKLRGSLPASTAEAEADSESCSARPLRLGDAAVLGSFPLAAALDVGVALPAQPSPFLVGLRALLNGQSSAQNVEDLGTGLRLLLPDGVIELLNRLAGPILSGRDKSLLRVVIDAAPPLAALPWEYLFIGSYFLCAHPNCSLVRFVPDANVDRSLQIGEQLKVLIWSGGADGIVGGFQQYAEQIKSVLSRNLGDTVRVEIVSAGSPRDLLSKLAEGYNVLHYVGEGQFGDAARLGYRRADDTSISWATVDQFTLGLINNEALKFVVLEVRGATDGPVVGQFAALAATMAQYIPAVLALRYANDNPSGGLFDRAFYNQLCLARSLSACVVRSRQELIAEYGQGRSDWGIPTIFTAASREVALRLPQTAPVARSRSQEVITKTWQLVIPNIPGVEVSRTDKGYISDLLSALESFKRSAVTLQNFIPTDLIYRTLSAAEEPSLNLLGANELTDSLVEGKRLLVLGWPGVGKTSFLQYLAIEYARKANGVVLPILVSLRSWDWAAQPTLLGHIKSFLAQPIGMAYPQSDALHESLDHYLADEYGNQYRLLFLLDDYHLMLHDEYYDRRIEAIEDFCQDYKRAMIVITSRTTDYDDGLRHCRFLEVALNLWREQQINDYLDLNGRAFKPMLRKYMGDKKFLSLAEIPYQLYQIVYLLLAEDKAGAKTGQRTPPPKLFESAYALMVRFIEQLIEDGSRSNDAPRLRVRLTQLLMRLADGLYDRKRRGAFVSYAEATGYLTTDTTDPQEIFRAAERSEILDLYPAAQKLGFERQQLEDYFRELDSQSGNSADVLERSHRAANKS